MNNLVGEHIEEYATQSKSGNVAKGYKALIGFLMGLRTHFINQHATEFIVGNFYQGYMDMSYFPLTPKSLKSQKLKIGVLFNHEKMQFEIWLVGQNKQIQQKFWEQFQSSDWNKYPISKNAHSSIIEHVLVKNPNFNHIDALTEKIESGVLKFHKDIMEVLA
ncbi:DUF7000 family protein [Flagellimonas sp.]|uniref:DUF7000 family protein n=1 Tax=Flagellimonas sp. TaxID=2058762 RepID=UPI003B51B5B2